jgi:hypothetical protein
MKKINYRNFLNKIKKNGYCIIPNIFSKKSLNLMRNSLLLSLNYIKPDKEKNLQKKYLQIAKYNKILAGHWYDLIKKDINLSNEIHKPEIVNLVKKYFKTEVVFSGRQSLHLIDDTNDKLLQPHQETKQLTRDFFLLWVPLFDTNHENGGVSIFSGSHKHGWFDYTKKLYTLKTGQVCTKNFKYELTQGNQFIKIVDPLIKKSFKKIYLEIPAGSLALFHSRLIHAGYPTRRKNSVRIIVSDRLCPLRKIPYLENEKALMRMPGPEAAGYKK